MTNSKLNYAFEVQSQNAVSPAAPVQGDIQDLLRQFLAYLEAEVTPPPPAPADGQAEVLDVQYNGHRYTLVRAPCEPPVDLVRLSPREKEIVRLVAKGLPNKTIATVLDISPWTIATHLRRVFAKLGVGSRAEMIARVIQDGLMDSGLSDQTE